MKGDAAMKRFLRAVPLLFLSLLLLTTTAFADFGPKPQLTVRVKNAPAEPYYLDILAKGSPDPSDEPYEGLDNSYSGEEIAALDQDLLATLSAAVPEGCHACTLQGTSGPPMWGDLYAESADSAGNPLHIFGYHGVPRTYRILMVTQSGEVLLSDVQSRKVLQSSVTLDWGEQTVSAPPTWVGYVLQFLSTLLPTLIIEGILLLLFGYTWKRSWKPFLLVNLATQGGMSVVCANTFLQHGATAWSALSLFPIEILILLAEALLYRRFLTQHTPGRAVTYAVFANVFSAVLGIFLAEPVWRFIVSIM